MGSEYLLQNSHNGSSMAPTLSQIETVHTLLLHPIKLHLNEMAITPRSPTQYVPLSPQLYTHFSSIPCQPHAQASQPHYFTILIIFTEQHRSWSTLLCNFFYLHVISYPMFKYSPERHFLKQIRPMYFIQFTGCNNGESNTWVKNLGTSMDPNNPGG